MDTVELLQGEVFTDHRGQIRSLNKVRLDAVKRMYVLHHKDTETVRGWNGHRFEHKWFSCMSGAFELRVVAPDNWETPSANLRATTYTLTATESQLLSVPGGHATLIRATTPDAVLAVFSDKTLEDSVNDSYRFDATLWQTNLEA